MCLFSPVSGRASPVSMATRFPVLVSLDEIPAECRGAQLQPGVEASAEATYTASPVSTPTEQPAQPGPMSQEPLFTRPDIRLEGDVMESSPKSSLRPIFLSSFSRVLCLPEAEGTEALIRTPRPDVLRIVLNPSDHRP